MNPPNNKFVTTLSSSELKVNTEGKKYESNGYTYDYVNYGNSKFSSITAQFPTYLPTTGMKEWISDSGNRSYTMLIQFPHVNPKVLAESCKVEAMPTTELRTFQRPDGTVERRLPTEAEVQQEIDILNFYVEGEKIIKKQAGITDNPNRFLWNGAVQVRNKPDPNDDKKVLEGEYYPVTMRFKVAPKINIQDFICQNDSFEEVEMGAAVTDDKEEHEIGNGFTMEQKIKIVKKAVHWSDVVSKTSVTPVHDFGRIYRITKGNRVECGWHLFLRRLSFLPKMIDENEETIFINNENETFLEMPKV